VHYSASSKKLFNRTYAFSCCVVDFAHDTTKKCTSLE
jgi:hypothetical protein